MEGLGYSLLLLLILIGLSFLAVCLSFIREKKITAEQQAQKAQDEIYKFLTEQPVPPTTHQQQAWLAFGAPIFLQFNEPLKEVRPEVSLLSISQYRQFLKQRWCITDSESAQVIIEHLLTLQDAHQLDALLEHKQQEVQQYLAAFTADNDPTSLEEAKKTSSTYAWDTARAIAVTRWCFWCGYLTEETMWRYIKQAAQTAQTCGLGSWVDYSVSILLGQKLSEPKRLHRNLDSDLLRLLGSSVYSPRTADHLPPAREYEIAIWREFDFIYHAKAF
ncbi:DUF1266 domain-containing protein [Pseudomonas sp. F1_0610]|uniref:DUF1266 domain-containing protein n=1 Tax=Pseudomonas sp. F1_0610 TaxID=3114284 RepID=UPI0039C304E4